MKIKLKMTEETLGVSYSTFFGRSSEILCQCCRFVLWAFSQLVLDWSICMALVQLTDDNAVQIWDNALLIQCQWRIKISIGREKPIQKN